MRNVIIKAQEKRLVSSTVFACLFACAFAACGTERVRVHIPNDHPAHPDAPAGIQPIHATALTDAEPASQPTPEASAPSDQHAHGQGGGAHEGQHAASAPASRSASAPSSRPADEQVYTCPMHPEIISSMPGRCPNCGMVLVRKESHR